MSKQEKGVKRASNNTKTVQDLLNYIQQNLNAPKNLYNSFGKYSYRSAEGILEAVKPLLPEGATLKLTDKVQEAGEMVYCEATAILSYKGEEERVQAQAGIPQTKKGMDLSQIFGASSSYARKYALNGLFLIDDNKDADTDEARTESENRPSTTPKPLSEVNASKTWLNENDANWSKALAFVKRNGKNEKTRTSILNKYKVSKANLEKLGL